MSGVIQDLGISLGFFFWSMPTHGRILKTTQPFAPSPCGKNICIQSMAEPTKGYLAALLFPFAEQAHIIARQLLLPNVLGREFGRGLFSSTALLPPSESTAPSFTSERRELHIIYGKGGYHKDSWASAGAIKANIERGPSNESRSRNFFLLFCHFETNHSHFGPPSSILPNTIPCLLLANSGKSACTCFVSTHFLALVCSRRCFEDHPTESVYSDVCLKKPTLDHLKRWYLLNVHFLTTAETS